MIPECMFGGLCVREIVCEVYAGAQQVHECAPWECFSTHNFTCEFGPSDSRIYVKVSAEY